MTVQSLLAVDPTSNLPVQYTPITSSAGAGDAGKPIATGTDGLIAESLMPTNVGPNTVVLPVSEAIAANAFVNIYTVAGVATARNADASAANGGKMAHGFVTTAAPTGNATVLLTGQNTGNTGLSPGVKYYLSGSTPGAMTTTAPSTSGYLVQALGEAVSSTILDFDKGGFKYILA